MLINDLMVGNHSDALSMINGDLMSYTIGTIEVSSRIDIMSQIPVYNGEYYGNVIVVTS